MRSAAATPEEAGSPAAVEEASQEAAVDSPAAEAAAEAAASGRPTSQPRVCASTKGTPPNACALSSRSGSKLILRNA